ncbi:MAG: sugar ABC transporter substrate-binding protein, partial [Anaerolineae bacterium]
MKNTSRLALLISVVLALAATACSGAPTASPPTVVPTLPNITLRFLITDDPVGQKAFQAVIDAFAKVRPDIRVNLENIPDDAEFSKRLASDFAAKTPPDVFVFDYPGFGEIASKGALQAVDDNLAKSTVIHRSDFYPAALDAFSLKGKQYCIPMNLSSLEVYYNKKLFAAANLSLPKAGWNWSGFLSDARALTHGNQYGVGVDPQTIRLVPFIWAHGGEFVDDPIRPTKLTLDSPAALEAFQWFVDLQVKEHVAPSRAAQATESLQARFEHGALGMFLMSRAATPELRDTIKDFDWDVAPLPSDKSTATILHSDGYCITNDSKNKDAAWAFVEFANGVDGQKTIAATGRTVPSLKSVAESPLFLSTTLAPANSKVYLDMAPNIRRVPTMTTWGEVEDFVNNEIERAFYGDASVTEAAQSAVKGTSEFFQQNL